MSHRNIAKKIMRNVLWSGIFFSIMAPAADASLNDSLSIGEPTLSDEHLEEMRGGFIFGPDFMVNFSIKETLDLDGVRQLETLVQFKDGSADGPFPDSGNSPAEGGQTASDAGNTDFSAVNGKSGDATQNLIVVSQTGPDNYIAQETLNNLQAAQTFIQNTLNDKIIQHSKIIDIEIVNYPFQRNAELISRINSQLLDLR